MTAGSGNDGDRTEVKEELPRASDVRSGTSLIDVNPVATQIGNQTAFRNRRVSLVAPRPVRRSLDHSSEFA